MTRIAVTGALGHIGSRLIREIPETFPRAEVVLIDDLSSQRYCSLFNLPESGRYEFIEADVVTAELRPMFDGVDVVVHLAAIADPQASVHDTASVERINVTGTEQVARACVHAGCPMIFVSTTSVYGTQSASVGEDCASHELRPQSPYAESKLRAEQLLVRLSHESGLRFVTCRFGTIFGTSVGMRFHTAINKFCWQAVNGRPLTVWRTALHQMRPYLDLGDAVRALTFLVRRELYDARTYNVVTTNASVKEICDMIERHEPGVVVEYVDSEVMNDLSFCVRDDRFRSAGFHCEGSLEKGIADTIDLLGGLSRCRV